MSESSSTHATRAITPCPTFSEGPDIRRNRTTSSKSVRSRPPPSRYRPRTGRRLIQEIYRRGEHSRPSRAIMAPRLDPKRNNQRPANDPTASVARPAAHHDGARPGAVAAQRAGRSGEADCASPADWPGLVRQTNVHVMSSPEPADDDSAAG